MVQNVIFKLKFLKIEIDHVGDNGPTTVRSFYDNNNNKNNNSETTVLHTTYQLK